ncbi:hypothetical protein [Polycladidibacter stylochi]|uniref:hypothetical protein n=1 Tax=Polycladidibacter stylochi TaxID=1807766 RepID=UPI00138F20C8|nr:hypothetical protein [Pseudovibrio stylochi]
MDSLRDMLNKRHGWADPQDPARAQETKRTPEHKERASSREEIQNWLEELIVAGRINNRTEMIGSLQSAGFEIPRAGKNYLTVKDPETNIRWRLKGTLFHEGWTREKTAQHAAQRQHANEHATGTASPSRLAGLSQCELREQYQSHIERRAKYNRQRYGRPSQSHQSRLAAPATHLQTTPAGGIQLARTPENEKVASAACGVLACEPVQYGNTAHIADLSKPALSKPQHAASVNSASELPALTAEKTSERQSLPPDRFANRPQPQLPRQAEDHRLQRPVSATNQQSTVTATTLSTERHSHDRPQRHFGSKPDGARAPQLRAAINRNIGAFTERAHRLGEALDRLAEQTAGQSAGLLKRFNQLAGSIQRGLDQLAHRAIKLRRTRQISQRDNDPSPEHSEKAEPQRRVKPNAQTKAPAITKAKQPKKSFSWQR